MGCFGSRVAFFRSCSFPTGRRGSRRQNIFAVQNVDDTGTGVSPGKLEVTETDLVLHVKGKPSLTWPLRCLRRYGYDNDLFSFESGRRCPTGAGIFAFRCHRAQSLFNLLQEKIQGNPSSLPTVPSTPITPPVASTPISAANNNPTTPVSSTFVYVNLNETNSSRILAGAGAPAPVVEQPDVVQTPSHDSTSNVIPAALRGPLVKASVDANHPVYMNVESYGGALYSTAVGPPYLNNLTSIPRPLRSSSALNGSSSDAPSTSSSILPRPSTSALAHPSSSHEAHPLYSNVICNKWTTPYPAAIPVQEPAEINYAELDLKTDRPSSSSSSPRSGRLSLIKQHHQLLSSSQSAPQPGDPLTTLRLGGNTDFHPKLTNNQNNGELGYATIDFDKTAALSVITRSKINLGFSDEPTSKKSRHNSTAL